jgi:hypothetical protein
MIPLLTAAPQAETTIGPLIAVTIALTVTALAAIGLAVVALRRRVRLSRLAVGIAGGTALAILVSALLVGGSLTRPSAAVADENGGRGQSEPVDAKFENLQLPTL